MEILENSRTVSEILDRYWQDCKSRLAPRTQKDYPRHIRIIKQHFGDRIAAELKPRDFSKFMDVPTGRIHRNRTLAVMSASFTHAIRRLYWLDRNVLRDVSRHEAYPRDRYITDAEFDGFVAWVPMLRIKLAMRLALLTGQRQGDLLSLRWDQVTDSILFRQAKTGKRLAIHITPALEAVLDECWQLPKRGDYVLGNEEGKRYTSEGFKSNWQRFMKQWKAIGNENFTFHDIRAKSASDSVSIEAAYERLGHQHIQQTRRTYDRGVRIVQPLR